MKSVACLAILLLIPGCLGVMPTAAQDKNRRQTPASAPAQGRLEEVSADSADLAITATVMARELRFEVVPNPTVEFTGNPDRRTEWGAERQNLPRPVQPGVTYRNIGIQLKIVSVFAEIDRIVAEALGEVPVSDETPRPQNAPAELNPSSATKQPDGRRPQ